MKKKKIAVIGLKGLPAFGGAATVGENILNQLKDEYDFTVLSISSHTDLKTGDYNGYKQVVFKSFLGKGGLNTAWYYFVSMLYVLFHKFDIVHLHHAASGFILPFIKLKCKTILTVHAYGEGADPKFNKILNYFGIVSRKIAINLPHIVTAVSLFDKENIEKVHNREILYIPNGTNIGSIPEKSLNEQFLLFAAGRIYNIKGLHLLVEAVNNLKLNKKIKIAGNLDRVPVYKKEILDKTNKLDLDFLGLIKDKCELMSIVRDAELFVFPSLYEAMSMMLFEVASMKTPIIASDIPANINVFSNEEVLFFKSGDSADLADKLEYALANMDEMKERAERAYIRLVENYTWDKIALSYKKIYDNLIV